MDEDKYIRKVQTSVTNFLYNGDDYLFIVRNKNKRIDPGRLNGVGGRLEPGEDYMAAAIREIEEETGYKVAPEDVRLAAVGKLEGGYQEDWVMCFFKVKVPTKQVPIDTHTEDGDLIWLNKDEIFDSEYELVDDLNYCLRDIIEDSGLVFFTAKVGDDQKIYEISISKQLKV